ncbi:MAG TPA: hypothetical protein EYQ74_02410 [Planctomycetes bacterium]|nr:hypothetical protein [Planctomycetota bacterium]
MTFEPDAGRDRSVVPVLLRARQLRSTEPVVGRTVGVLDVGLAVVREEPDRPEYEELDRVGVVTVRVGVERVGVVTVRVGAERVGAERVGAERVGVCVERVGVDLTGVDRTGVDRTGVERTGVDRTGFWRLDEPARTGLLWLRLRWALALSAANTRENARARRRRGRWLNMMAFFLGGPWGRTVERVPRRVRVRSDPAVRKIGAELAREG